MFRTTDGGASWTRVHAGGVVGAPLIARSDGAICWLVEGGGGVIRSADGGATWNVVSESGDFSSSTLSIVELPDGSLATLGGQRVIVSTDGGRTWGPVGPALPYQPFGLTYSPFRQAFYIWRFDCDTSRPDNPVSPDAIMRLDFASQ